MFLAIVIHMKKTPAYYIDSVLSKLVAFVPGIVIARYFSGNLWNILLFGIVFALTVSGLYMTLISKTLKAKPDKRTEEIRRQFVFSDDRFALNFFREAFSKHGRTVLRKRRFIGIGRAALFCRFSIEPLSADTVLDMTLYAKKNVFDKVVILTDLPAPAAQKLVALMPDMTVTLFDWQKTDKLLKWLDAAPDITLPSPQKRSVKDIFKALIDPKRAAAYFFSGLLLLGFSTFFALSIYYLIAGSALIAFAATLALSVVVLKRRKNR